MRYYITGATGFLGLRVVNDLLKQGDDVTAFVMPGDKGVDFLPAEVKIVYGDITSKEDVNTFLSGGGEGSTVIHCAGMISLLWGIKPIVKKVNVTGTQNIVEACIKQNMRLIYISSVHSIPEKPKGQPMEEVSCFNPKLVVGGYAKTKAMATAYVIDAIVNSGLNAGIIFPSGIIGPGAFTNNSVIHMMKQYIDGKLPAGVKGGYNFVDVRDVSSAVISLCNKKDKKGCYIISGHYVSIEEFLSAIHRNTDRQLKKLNIMVPRWFVNLFAVPVYAVKYFITKETPIYTRYSIYTLSSNSNFISDKAKRELDFSPRPFDETIRDTILWMEEKGIV